MHLFFHDLFLNGRTATWSLSNLHRFKPPIATIYHKKTPLLGNHFSKTRNVSSQIKIFRTSHTEPCTATFRAKSLKFSFVFNLLLVTNGEIIEQKLDSKVLYITFTKFLDIAREGNFSTDELDFFLTVFVCQIFKTKTVKNRDNKQTLSTYLTC